jgi:hypothetical protein
MTAMAVPAAPAPWPPREFLLLGVSQLAGFGLLALSWLGVSGTTKFSAQVAWTNVGGAGLLVVVAACALWVHRGRTQVGRRLAFAPLLRRSEQALSLWGTPPNPRGPVMVRTGSAETFVSAAGMSHYHRADCQAVGGKTVTSASAEQHRRQGRQPCGMCEA